MSAGRPVPHSAREPTRRLRLVTFGTLYPDATRPQHGVFVEHRLRQLLAQGGIEARVVAPVPWFPLRHPRYGAWSEFARVARRENRFGIDVEHPRFPVLPRVGMLAAPALLALGARATLSRLRAAGFDFDCIDAHYFYPDGVAAVLLGRYFGRPVTITARGSDLNVIARYRLPRRMIVAAARCAAALITVSEALKDVLVDLGIAPSAVHVLRNGVDLDFFHPPPDRAALREQLGLAAPTLLFAGNLVPLKGCDLVLEALRSLPGIELAVAGTGTAEPALRHTAAQEGLAGRVRFLGRLTQAELRDWYGACDALVLASASEGLPNVVLEAMACGTPVVATDVGGIPEVLNVPAAGEIVAERTADGIARAVRRLLARAPDREDTRSHARKFSWQPTAAALKAVLERAAFSPGSRAAILRA